MAVHFVTCLAIVAPVHEVEGEVGDSFCLSARRQDLHISANRKLHQLTFSVVIIILRLSTQISRRMHVDHSIRFAWRSFNSYSYGSGHMKAQTT